ncbi:unknown [Paraprevotella clara CAG:116]|nr:unknown [Paraprevotella clara CAG:116]
MPAAENGLYIVCDELNRMFTSPSFRQPLMVEPEKLVATMPASSMPSLW